MQRSCGSRDSKNFLALKGGLHAQKAESDGNKVMMGLEVQAEARERQPT